VPWQEEEQGGERLKRKGGFRGTAEVQVVVLGPFSLSLPPSLPPSLGSLSLCLPPPPCPLSLPLHPSLLSLSPTPFEDINHYAHASQLKGALSA